MRPIMLVLTLALVACVSDPGGARPDGVVDGSTPDAALDAAPVDEGLTDAVADMTPDGASPDGALPDDCPDAEALIADFYDSHGGPDAFDRAVRHPFEAFLRGEAAVCRRDFVTAAAELAAVWSARPPGSPAWSMVWDAGRGANLGTPVAYYGLRMLQDVIDHGRDGPRPETQPVRLTVVLPGCAEGIQPRNWQELRDGGGEAVRHTLDPAVTADDYAIMRASLDFFGRYVHAMTRGHLRLAVQYVELPEVCVPVYAEAEPNRVASIRSPAPAFEALDRATVDATDWWMVVYPSHVPEQYPDFEGAEFISGGMGRHANGGPLFLADDRWFVRKPPHLGEGPYTMAERRTYLPQWLQHEFYHNLFLLFPEHGLEERSHQWFDRDTWPDDFEGLFEADYYHEALHRRFWDSDPPLRARLRNAAPDPTLWGELPADAIPGRYAREPVQNPWHTGAIAADGDGWRWTNEAGVSWGLGDAIAQGRLTGGMDNPYFGQGDVDFHLVLASDGEGGYLPSIAGFRFLGELYRRVEQ